MSPELIDPERFGFEKRQPTESSDCYALGMVIYETISGEFPFCRYTDYTVSLKVMAGERPPRRPKFTDSLWEMLQLCWTSHPDDRPSVGGVLQCLQMASSPPEPSSSGLSEGMEEDSDDWDPPDSPSTINSFSLTSKGKKRAYDPDLTLPPIIGQTKRRRVHLGSFATENHIRLPPIHLLLNRSPEFIPASSNPNDSLRSDYHDPPSRPSSRPPPTRYQENKYHPRNPSLSSPSKSPNPGCDHHAALISDQPLDSWAFPAHPQSNSLTSGAARPAPSNSIAFLLAPATSTNRSKESREPRKTVTSRERVQHLCDEPDVQLVE